MPAGYWLGFLTGAGIGRGCGQSMGYGRGGGHGKGCGRRWQQLLANNLGVSINEIRIREIPATIQKLASQNIKASTEMSIRDIAEQNGTDAI